MEQVKPFEIFTQRYDKWFDDNPNAYFSEVNLIREITPKGFGIEVGVGTGRFSKPLDVEIGVDPSIKMGKIAKKRGIKFIVGLGENLPFKTEYFDFLICVTTICFLKNLNKAFEEAYRILKKGGRLILGFVDKNSILGVKYSKETEQNPFYRVAKFYSVEEIINLTQKNGFTEIEIYQTIFRKLENIDKIEPVEKGYGKGSFVALTGIK
ncbi:MAG: class I SAM-dependent methyltransferase [Promethearchaeota archaeon]|nr:MAG: class I SAM-dependent methyltransferase [Candidatus Lokiarchaeota archaeon]